MKTRHRSHPVAPYTASTPRSPAPMGKRNPTGTRMGVKGSDPALYNHNGDIIDTKAIQAEVVRKTQENIAAKAAASQVVVLDTDRTFARRKAWAITQKGKNFLDSKG